MHRPGSSRCPAFFLEAPGTTLAVLHSGEHCDFIARMKLPNGEREDLGTKLEDYTLNPAHRDGRHKARVFASALGLSLNNYDVLKAALLQMAAASDQFEARGDNGFGQVYVLRFSLATAAGTATVMSAWIIRHGEGFPRLTTCYIV